MPETAAAPPTPPIPLAALLAREDLGLRQIAGPVQAGAAVHMVHTSEMADPYPYLLGGELLLSAGVLLKDPDRYVSRIVEAGATALGFGLAPVYDAVPADLIEACDRHGLPLLEVPPQTTFTAVARAVWRLMAEARHRELRRVTQAQQGLAAAAARPDPVPAVLHQLAVRLEGWAVLLAPDGTELSSSGRAPSPEARAGVIRLGQVVSPGTGPSPRPTPASATDTVSPPPASESGAAGPAAPAAPAVSHLSAYALGGSRGLVLGLAAPAREAGDHTVAGVAVVLLSLLTAPHQGADAAGCSAALVRMLLGASPAETAPLLGPGPWTVVHGQGSDDSPFAATALGAALGSALVDPDADGCVRVLLPASREVGAQAGWTLGVSAPARPEELAAADAQAARAVRRATATRKALVRHRDTAPISLDEARHRLAPLTDSPALVETLRTWLSLHGSWDRTAAAMEIHRNTVRQRIARCQTLLDEDLDDADVRMELWFALRHG
ncbi:PucR family transcriptional regulator [Streptomyces sp. NBC_01481]|uniref:PucR family transcriptional regulator n=1 Tax=Streptomyces sp. NBC_01481 TaxID=2975869 RepID=UPI00225855C8|nr:PucR family transcriptional regulator [Streptomyces sp. NBC_01481]MCX4582024.1 PucR family transcriptional regulator [Streptomyces sp. NBC_01481]